MGNRTLSKGSFLAMGGASPLNTEAAHERLEDVAAVIEIAELIEAGAGGREHHRVAGEGVRRRGLHGLIERPRLLLRDRTPKRRGEFLRGLADQVGAAGLAADH